MKKNDHYAILLFTIFLLTATINSCYYESDESKEYISIYIENHTEETILVYAGAFIIFLPIPSASIPSGKGQNVLVEKGESVYVQGKDSTKNYGSRTFFFETRWHIH